MSIFARLFGRGAASAVGPSSEIASIPEAPAAKRRAGRRTYMAARPDRVAGGFQYAGVPGSNPEIIRQSLRGLISHARYTARNSDYAKAFLMMVRRNVLGPTGIRLSARSRDLGGKLDKVANAKIEAAWVRWGRMENCSVCGGLSLRDIEKIVLNSHARDGNILIRMRAGGGFGRFGFQLQLFSIDQLDIDLNADLGSRGYVAGGIEMDGDGRRVAYHMWSRHPGQNWGRSNLERVRVPAREIIHLFPIEDPGQFLGVPPMHTALRRMNMLHHYEEAALTNAQFGARSVAFLESTSEDDDPRRADDGEDDEGAFNIELDNGSVVELPINKKLSAFDPAYPDSEMAVFVQHMLRGSAAGLGVSYHGLANDLTGANFSSLHYGANEERDEWRTIQAWFAEKLHDQIYPRWLEWALLTGELRLPFAKFDKFAEVTWRPRGWPAVNPKDDAKSAATNLANALTSPQMETGKRGLDFEDVLDDLAAAIESAKAKGVPLDFLAMGAAAASSGDGAGEGT